MGRLAGFSADEVIRKLRRAGFVFDRQAKGSHEIWWNPQTHARTTVPHHPDVCLTIIRPSFVVGPGFNNPLARHLKKKIVPLPPDTAPFQFIHEDDLVEIIYQLLSKKKEGAYNLAADGTMTFDEMLHILGNRPLKLPPSVLYPFNSIMWFLRIKFMSEFPSPALNMVRYPWIASNKKLKKELNYKFKYTTKEAFEDFARHVKARS